MSQAQSPIHEPYTVGMPDVYAAVRDFVAAWALPPLDASRIVRGLRDKTAVPPDSGEYAVITILADNRRGTNVSGFTTNPATREDGVLTRSQLVVCDVLAEFYGDAETARHRALVIETAARDEFATRFFAPYGIAPLYADATREIAPGEGYATTLHVSYWVRLSAGADWFDNANVHLLAEVDTYYPTED